MAPTTLTETEIKTLVAAFESAEAPLQVSKPTSHSLGLSHFSDKVNAPDQLRGHGTEVQL